MDQKSQSQAQHQNMSQKQMFYLSNILERLIVSFNKVVHIESQNNDSIDLSQFSLYYEGQNSQFINLEHSFLDICIIIKSLGFSVSEISKQKSDQILYFCAKKYLCLDFNNIKTFKDFYNHILQKIQAIKNPQYQQDFPGQKLIACCFEMLYYTLLKDQIMASQIENQIQTQYFKDLKIQQIKTPLVDNDMIYQINNNMFKSDVTYENEKDNQPNKYERNPNFPQDFNPYSNVVNSSSQFQNQPQYCHNQYQGNNMHQKKN
ncbi:hypothetical protein ABPG74_016121 [Tetrahymena malaccensis]